MRLASCLVPPSLRPSHDPPPPFAQPVFSAFKQHWSEARKEVLLSVQASCLAQIDSAGRVLSRYDYNKIEAVCLVSAASSLDCLPLHHFAVSFT